MDEIVQGIYSHSVSSAIESCLYLIKWYVIIAVLLSGGGIALRLGHVYHQQVVVISICGS